MEQRTQNRWPVNGTATAFCLSGDQFGQMHDLQMLDCGQGGLGAMSSDPLETGALITIGFEHSGYTAQQGKVVTCHPWHRGFRVAIRFEGAAAA